MIVDREYYDVISMDDVTYSVRRVAPADGFKFVVLQDGLTQELADSFKSHLMDAYNDGADHAKTSIREHLIATLCL